MSSNTKNRNKHETNTHGEIESGDTGQGLRHQETKRSRDRRHRAERKQVKPTQYLENGILGEPFYELTGAAFSSSIRHCQPKCPPAKGFSLD